MNYRGVIIYMNKDVLNYIINNLINSSAFYFVHGTPELRLKRIREYAMREYNNMSIEQWENILKQVEINKRKNKK